MQKHIGKQKSAAATIRKATRQYERWLAQYTPLVAADLDFKHREMATGVFPFLRAAYYRWAQHWPAVCGELARAPAVLSVGDLHVENFGTWRDAEGRLAWGVNDFDEASFLAYTHDLVRLAASAQLAIAANHLCLECVHACDAILSGYMEGLKAGGKPFVLAEEHAWLRDIAHTSLSDPVSYWEKMHGLPAAENVPESARVAMEHLLPAAGTRHEIKRRTAGLGSLGHPRFVTLTAWAGGDLAREAKALVPPSCDWAGSGEAAVEIFYQAIVERAVRCRDPFVALEGHWIVRRLAPDCARIELASLPKERSESRLLYAMGWETANIHLGSKSAVPGVKADLRKRKKGWLRSASDKMAAAIHEDWSAWKAG
jgi:hypothetical protein